MKKGTDLIKLLNFQKFPIIWEKSFFGIIGFFVFLITSVPLMAAGLPGEYLFLHSPSAASSAMGGIEGATAASFYLNPAEPAFCEGKEFSFMNTSLLDSASLMSSFFTYPFGKRKTFSVGYVSLGVEGAEWVDSWGVGNRGTFSDIKRAYILGGSFPLGKFLTGGLSLKLAEQKIHLYEGSGFGCDIGILYSRSPKNVFSFALQNVVSPSYSLRENSEEDSFPINGRFSFRRSSSFFRFALSLAAENLAPSKDEKTNFYPAFGGELNIMKNLCLRAGWERYLRAGIGIKISRVGFDVASIFHEEGMLFSASVSLRFGIMPDLWEKKLIEKEEILQDFSKNLEVEKKYLIDAENKMQETVAETVKLRLDAARRYVRVHDFDLAMKEIEAIFQIDPGNEEAAKLKDDITSGKLKADLQYAIAWQFYKNGRYQDALKKAEKALKLNRQHPRAEFLKNMAQARIFIDKGNYYQAKVLLLDAFKIDPENPECLQLLQGVNEILKAQPAGKND